MAGSSSEKAVMIVGIDESDESFYALEWTLDHFFAPYAPIFPFNVLLVYAKPPATSAIGLTGPGATEVHDVAVKVVEGDARNVLCEAVEKNNAAMLVVGNHGYGVIKRAFLGSVSDYCARHAHCSVMIIKKPKTVSTGSKS
uniref:UspA domain-containing protein n=1 Tax=Chenopodium quinoa TaxID=63459 RepID=A0A803L9V6_CHEQI